VSTATRRALMAFLIMLCCAGLAQALKPTIRLADVRALKVNLETAVPKAFGSWQLDTSTSNGVINPQQLEMINKLYSQTLSRTYVDPQGHRVMLSIAYGEDQRDGLVVHHPEICYPAQGFDVISNQMGVLQTPRGDIKVRRLETVAGNSRFEPVTYWTTVGDQVTLGGVSKKLKEMQYSLHGQIPDGLLFRVSSIGRDSAAQFALQDRYVVELLASLNTSSRQYLAGQP